MVDSEIIAAVISTIGAFMIGPVIAVLIKKYCFDTEYDLEAEHNVERRKHIKNDNNKNCGLYNDQDINGEGMCENISIKCCNPTICYETV